MTEEALVLEGEVLEALPDAFFRVRLREDLTVLAHLAGKLRLKRIRVVPGDRVAVELSPYNLSRGRIIRRL